MERYSVNYFNLRAKPDFRKRGGAQTEHCEQDVRAVQNPKFHDLHAIEQASRATRLTG